jgi:hypothetical protein
MFKFVVAGAENNAALQNLRNEKLKTCLEKKTLSGEWPEAKPRKALRLNDLLNDARQELRLKVPGKADSKVKSGRFIRI